MIRPSYTDLISKLAKNEDEEVLSRYSIVIATAKRARQIVAENNDGENKNVNPVSIATGELYNGKIKIVKGESFTEEGHMDSEVPDADDLFYEEE